MDINIKSPVSILKGIGMFLLLLAASGLALTGVAYAVNLVAPGKGDTVKSLFRI